MRQNGKIMMVGPNIDGLGGISRVVRIWRDGSVFSDNEVKYISTVTDRGVNKGLYLLKAFASFVGSILKGQPLVYIHTSSYNSFRRKSVFLAAGLMFRRKIVLHIHPTHFHQFVLELKGIERALTHFLLNRVDGLVVLTEEMRASMDSLFHGRPVYVLRNPVDVSSMKNSDGWEREHRRLLYLGWYIREKGVYDLVDAIEILILRGTTVFLDLFGTKQVKELRTYVKRKQLEGAVSVHEWIDDREKCKALHRATALVLPSYSEGMPNVILEAMATRTPIISTQVGGLKEVLRDGENAIITKAGDPTDLSEKILRCLNDAELRNRIAANAYEEALAKYDVSIVKKELSRILRQLPTPS